MDESKLAELREIVLELDDLSYKMLDHSEAETLCGIIDKFKEWDCKVTNHDWTYDQCGYWQHQYCVKCGSSKYPDLASKRCEQLNEEMGRMTEAEFTSKQ